MSVGRRWMTSENQRMVMGMLSLALLVWGCANGEELADRSGETDKTRNPLSETAVEENHGSPIVAGVYLTPSSPHPGDRIKARVEASDPDGDPLEIVYQWYENGRRLDETGSSLLLTDLRKDSVVEVAVVARDGFGQSKPVRASVKMGNRAPAIRGVVIEPLGEVTVNRDITARVEAEDPDGDEIRYQYGWFVNGRRIRGGGPLLSTQYFHRGDEIVLSVVASDGDDSSRELRSEPIRVANANPTIVSSPGSFGGDGVFRYRIEAVDSDGDRMFRYVLPVAPTGMKLDVVRGMVSWEPQENQAGTHEVAVEVHDRSGGVARQEFDVTVSLEEPLPAAPRF
ncbi:Ig domain-containing protein [Myxococcota bacterium]|nr:Ig domain-containing protein [Myxococcota bacterium]